MQLNPVAIPESGDARTGQRNTISAGCEEVRLVLLQVALLVLALGLLVPVPR